MKFIILILLFILCSIKFGQTALAQYPNAVHRDYPGKCVYDNEVQKIVISPGDVATERKTCTRISCDRGYHMVLATCGVIGVAPNCYLSDIDQTQDYPDCCPEMLCPEITKY